MKADSVSGRSDSLSLKISRGGEILTFKEYFKGKKTVGFYPAAQDYLRAFEKNITYGFIESIPRGTERAFSTLGSQVKALGRVVTGALSPKESLSGPIGIAQAFGYEWDWSRFWSLTGVLSLVLAFMNLLPIPAWTADMLCF